MYGEAPFGEIGFGDAPSDIGVPIIVEVTLATAELVFVVEIDLIQPILGVSEPPVQGTAVYDGGIYETGVYAV